VSPGTWKRDPANTEVPSEGFSRHRAASPASQSTPEQAIGALIARDASIADYLGPKIAQCEAAGPIPQLGTAEWENLDDGDPRKVGACSWSPASGRRPPACGAGKSSMGPVRLRPNGSLVSGSPPTRSVRPWTGPRKAADPRMPSLSSTGRRSPDERSRWRIRNRSTRRAA